MILDRAAVTEEASRRGLPVSCWRTHHLLDEGVLYLKGEVYWLEEDCGGMELAIFGEPKFLVKRGTCIQADIHRHRFGERAFERSNGLMREGTGAMVVHREVGGVNPRLFRIDMSGASRGFRELLDSSPALRETRIVGGGRLGDIRSGKYRMAIPVWDFNE